MQLGLHHWRGQWIQREVTCLQSLNGQNILSVQTIPTYDVYIWHGINFQEWMDRFVADATAAMKAATFSSALPIYSGWVEDCQFRVNQSVFF